MNDVDRVTAHYEARDRANAAKLKLLCKQYDDHIRQLADELQTARQVAREAQAAEKAATDKNNALETSLQEMQLDCKDKIDAAMAMVAEYPTRLLREPRVDIQTSTPKRPPLPGSRKTTSACGGTPCSTKPNAGVSAKKMTGSSVWRSGRAQQCMDDRSKRDKWDSSSCSFTCRQRLRRRRVQVRKQSMQGDIIGHGLDITVSDPGRHCNAVQIGREHERPQCLCRHGAFRQVADRHLLLRDQMLEQTKRETGTAPRDERKHNIDTGLGDAKHRHLVVFSADGFEDGQAGVIDPFVAFGSVFGMPVGQQVGHARVHEMYAPDNGHVAGSAPQTVEREL